MSRTLDRRLFLQQAAAAAAACGLAASPLLASTAEPKFRISLAQWSLHKALFSGKLTNLDFAAQTAQFGIEAVEYVNQFFKDKAKDQKYLGELNQRAADHNVKNLLIMIDNEGQLGDPDEARRLKAVENHYPWVEAAKTLGCHSVRVNAYSKGSPEEQLKLAADGMRRLSEFAAQAGINVIVENHGGLSSNGEWIVNLVKRVGLENFGTLPDFGNFKDYDRYQGVREMMPYAKGVSAKSYHFDEEGNDTQIDYARMLKIVLDAGYRGYIGIEFEGSKISEADGILATKKLLERFQS